MAVNDVFEVRIASVIGAQTAFSVLHYQQSITVGGGASMQDVANTLNTTLGIAYRGVMSAVATYRGVGVRKIFPLPPGPESITVAPGAGGIAGEPLPKQSTGMLTKRTALAGRSFRGRVYLPFPSEGSNTGQGEPDALYLAAAGALGMLLDNSLVVVASPPAPPGDQMQINPIVWSRLTLSATPITAMIVRPRWATQRRRGDYGRTNLSPF